MKKIFLLLNSLTLCVVPLVTVVSCQPNKNKTSSDNEPIPPKDYNLTENLSTLNRLEFSRQYSNLESDNYFFENSWFALFKTQHTWGQFTNYILVNQEEKLDSYFNFLLDNSSGNEPKNMEVPGFSWEKNPQDIIALKLQQALGIHQSFFIISPLLSLDNSFNLANSKLVDNKVISMATQPHSYEVGANKKINYRLDCWLNIYHYQGFLSFEMGAGAKIITKATQLKTNENIYFSYDFATLIKNAHSQPDYAKALSETTGFLFWDQTIDSIILNMSANLTTFSASMKETLK